MAGLENLKVLHVTRKKIKTLSNNLLDDVKNLRVINFTQNKLVSVSPEMLQPLRKLTNANFRDNAKINVKLNPKKAPLIVCTHKHTLLTVLGQGSNQPDQMQAAAVLK